MSARLTPLVLLVALLSPALPLPSAAADTPDDDVVVTAVLRSGDGLVFRDRPATSEAAGEALAARWDDERGVVAADVAHTVRATATPAPDPFRPLQWGLDRLAAERAWQTSTGTGAVVAVVDTGVQADHPDLLGQVLPPLDLVEPSATRTVGVDPNGHGTHVAGIVAAAAGNGVGVAGLAPGARVLPVRVLDSTGAGSDATVARGIVAAVDAGADVVNLSLGGPERSTVLDAAVAYAVARGVVVVAAAGNDGDGALVEYPAASPGVLAVGAVDADDVRAPFSSTGAYVDLAAPGVGIGSTYSRGRYVSLDGTSMAAPFVAASAALLVGAGTPRGQVPARLLATAQDLGPAGRDDGYGAGLVDVVAALAPVVVPAAATAAVPAPAPAVEPPAPVVAPQPAPSVAAPVPAPVPAPPTGPVPAEPAPAPVAAPVVVPVPARAPSPSPAPAPAPAPVVLRLSASAPVVPAGGAVVLTARVPGGADVVLERRTAGGGWALLRTGRAAADGLVSWSLRPDRGAEHRVRVGGTASPVVAVAVRQRVTTTARRGVVGGTVAPAGVVAVQVQRRAAGGAWTTVARTTTTSAGRYATAVRVPPGTVVRVVAAARAGLQAGTGPAVRLPGRVRPRGPPARR